MKKLLLSVLTACSLFGGIQSAQAEYPERPVQFVVPWPPGDLEDVLTRMIAEEMQNEHGAPAAVINKPGGGAAVGASYVAQKPADGYTVGSFVIGVPTAHIIRGNATWEKDTFEPVGIFLTYPFGLVAAKDAPYNNMKELAAYAKENKVKLGHFGFGLPPTLTTFKAAETLGFKFAGEAAFDELNCGTLSNGDADVINTTMQLVQACLKSGDAKVIAAFTEERMAHSPDGMTLKEQVEGLDLVMWNGLFVKKGTPQIVKDKLEAAAKKVMASDKAKELSTTTGAQIYWMDAATAKERIEADYARVEDLITSIEKKAE